VFESKVLRRKFGPKRYEVTREWRTLHTEDPNDRYSSPIIVRAINSRRLRWTKPVARMRGGEALYKVLVGKPQGK
jgi:hypothetical protein